jgi:hypothetical protein
VSIKLQIAQSTIDFGEAGTQILRSDQFFALAKALGISARTLAQAMGIDVSGVSDDNEYNQ